MIFSWTSTRITNLFLTVDVLSDPSLAFVFSLPRALHHVLVLRRIYHQSVPKQAYSRLTFPLPAGPITSCAYLMVVTLIRRSVDFELQPFLHDCSVNFPLLPRESRAIFRARSAYLLVVSQLTGSFAVSFLTKANQPDVFRNFFIFLHFCCTEYSIGNFPFRFVFVTGIYANKNNPTSTPPRK